MRQGSGFATAFSGRARYAAVFRHFAALRLRTRGIAGESRPEWHSGGLAFNSPWLRHANGGAIDEPETAGAAAAGGGLASCPAGRCGRLAAAVARRGAADRRHRRAVHAHRRRRPRGDRPRFPRSFSARLFRLHVLPRCLPDHADRNGRRARKTRQAGRPAAAAVHHRRSRARHAQSGGGVHRRVQPAHPRPDRNAAADRRGRSRIPRLLRRAQRR